MFASIIPAIAAKPEHAGQKICDEGVCVIEKNVVMAKGPEKINQGQLISTAARVRAEQFKITKKLLTEKGYHGKMSMFATSFNQEMNQYKWEIRERVGNASEFNTTVVRNHMEQKLAEIRESIMPNLTVNDTELPEEACNFTHNHTWNCTVDYLGNGTWNKACSYGNNTWNWNFTNYTGNQTMNGTWNCTVNYTGSGTWIKTCSNGNQTWNWNFTNYTGNEDWQETWNCTEGIGKAIKEELGFMNQGFKKKFWLAMNYGTEEEKGELAASIQELAGKKGKEIKALKFDVKAIRKQLQNREQIQITQE